MKYMQSFSTILCLLSIFFAQCNAQYSPIPLDRFQDSAHHWYDIKDEEHVIEADSNQQKYASSEITAIADNILLFQKDNGGWPKNHDMTAILTQEQVTKVLKHKSDRNTTIDNGATHSHIAYLARVFKQTGVEKYKTGCLKGLDYLLEAQYANGGFPQFYPDVSGYRKYITFNDGAMIGVMDVYLDIVKRKPEYAFIQTETYAKIRKAWELGIDCILKCQIVENGELTVWCQQHDNVDLRPRNARAFEPASKCNGESSDIVLHLMRISDPDSLVKESISGAVAWFKKSALKGLRYATVEAKSEKFIYHTTNTDRVILEDSTAPLIWPRFSELITNRPIFCNRDAKVVYTLAEVERERRTGYGWYIYSPQEVLDKYPQWKNKVTRNK